MTKILVIDDEVNIVKALKLRLSANGYHVSVAYDGVQGVQLASRENPDLIILDLMLPGGGGPVVLHNIRQHACARYVPVVVLSGADSDEMKKKVMDEGIDAYIEKPFDDEELLAAIRDVLQKHLTRNRG